VSSPKSWQDVPPGTIAFGSTALDVQTGLWRSMRPVIDESKCISCLRCWLQCPDMSIKTDENSKLAGIDLFFCKGCGICASVCPVKAISMHQEADFHDQENVKHGEHPGDVGAHVK